MKSANSGQVMDGLPSVPSVYDHSPAANDPVRLRTLTLIRWFAIVGQALALLVVHFGFGFPVPLAAAFAVVGASLMLNLIGRRSGSGNGRRRRFWPSISCSLRRCSI